MFKCKGTNYGFGINTRVYIDLCKKKNTFVKYL